MLSDLGLCREKDYAQTMDRVVLPYLDAHKRSFRVKGTGDRDLYTVCYQADLPRGTVLICHGFTENSFKYAELIHAFLRQGYSVTVYDQRGHGRSWRDEKLTAHDLTHVDHFTEYVEDLRKVAVEVLPAMTPPYDLFSHSMGGAVAALCLEAGTDPFRKAIFMSPMIQPMTGSIPPWITRIMTGAFCTLGRGKERVFTSSPYHGEAFEHGCATSEVRFGWYEHIRRETPEYQNCSPTYGWVRESLNVKKKILQRAEVEKIRIPVRVYMAELDQVVLAEPQKQFVRRLPQGSLQVVAGAKHEIYRSEDRILDVWWADALRFLETS